LALLVAACLQVAACGPTPGGSSAPGGGSSPVGTTSVPGSTASGYAPLAPMGAVPAAKAAAVHLKTQPGGATMADLDHDTDPFDAVEPKVNAIFTADDSATPAAATIKTRGHSTRLTDQKSYAVALAKDAEGWHGDRDLNFNKHPYDLTRLRNKLSFDLFQGIPDLPALRASFVTLDVDGKPYGLFTQIEEPDKGFLRRLKLDDKGQFYKAQEFAFTRTDALKNVGEAGYDEKAFEKVLSIKGAKDHAKLLQMLDDLANQDKPIDEIIAKDFNRPNYVTWFATQILLENLDTNTQNFYLYSPSNGTAWTFVPWDYDGGWGFYEQPSEQADGGGLNARWREGVGNWWEVALHKRFVSNPADLAQLVARVDELADTYFTPARIQAYVDSYKGVVRPAVTAEPDASKLPLHGGGSAGSQWDAEVARIVGVVAKRRALLHDSLERPMPFWLGDPEGTTGAKRFTWDPAVDLQGDAVSYDLLIGKTPTFAEGDAVVKQTGLKETSFTVSDKLAPGTYYWRVIARDAKDPAKNWQISLTQWDSADGKQHVYGTKDVTF
jgi:spore coat protein H